MGSDAVLIAQDVIDARERGRVGRIAQAYPGLDLGTARRDALDQWGKGAIEEQHAVFGVVHDVNQLLGMQPRVAGVYHHAAPGYGVIEFQMPMVIPGKGRDGIARAQPQVRKRMRELARARGALRIGVAKQRSVRLARHDFRIAELGGGMFDHTGYQQGPIHAEAGLEHFLNLHCWFCPKRRAGQR
jgi:hypothetical protein